MLLFPNCKINLGLDILRRREDGFHDIETVMIPVRGVCDGLEIVRAKGCGVGFTSSGLPVDCVPGDNLVLRAFEAMRSEFGIDGVKIHLHKAIPFGAGLGGGSADAAFTVKGLNELFGLGLDISAMESLAAKLGSDTPFFIRNEPMLCSGRGEIMSAVDIGQLSGKHLLIVKPEIGISTAEAYSGVTPAAPAQRLADRIKMPIAIWKDIIFNDFEKTIFKTHPQLERIKSSLYEAGALYASMSGSGSALYGIFDHTPEYTPGAGETIYCIQL